ncbi:ankyrin repeat domain-containing protein, partial [Ruminococcus flavefaciens]
MKKLFKAIRNGDFNEVKEIITKKPELVNCVAKQPPKKDDGQSPLQVALKTGNFEIAKYLIEMGADLN